ncbi:nuclear transport factor 2 family protein [Amycolatopsis aidingensis]|uniref:nuclear transport factor 2 family protein n=1 Tax=Amycolatopsis aidingensis TaxID=2842453 RepID=UPI001C0D12D0|nr:nuclear transport factor 2 family protein [Amycolatopsis aidingensis]
MTLADEKADIAETVIRLFHALDAHDWTMIRTLTGDPIDVDYPSKQGGPERLGVEDFVSGLKGFLPGFDATQHLVGSIVAEVSDGITATARFHARVTHLLTEAGDDLIWTIGCHYTLGLDRREGSWKLRSSRVRVVYEEGDRGLEELARRRVVASGSPG